jgi:hypothetical protein
MNSVERYTGNAVSGNAHTMSYSVPDIMYDVSCREIVLNARKKMSELDVVPFSFNIYNRTIRAAVVDAGTERVGCLLDHIVGLPVMLATKQPIENANYIIVDRWGVPKVGYNLPGTLFNEPCYLAHLILAIIRRSWNIIRQDVDPYLTAASPDEIQEILSDADQARGRKVLEEILPNLSRAVRVTQRGFRNAVYGWTPRSEPLPRPYWDVPRLHYWSGFVRSGEYRANHSFETVTS